MPGIWQSGAEGPATVQRATVRRGMRRPLALAIALAAVAATTLLLASCRGWSQAGVEPTPAAPPTATAVPGTLTSVRGIDFRDPALLGPIVNHFGGGEVAPERVVYTDLTGDRVEEAVAIVESGGTADDLGAAAFDLQQGRPRLLGYIDRGGRVEVRLAGPVAALINVREGVYAPGDPLCCPARLRETVYQWSGERFAVVTEQVIDNPDR